jgi:hypothetical protein
MSGDEGRVVNSRFQLFSTLSTPRFILMSCKGGVVAVVEAYPQAAVVMAAMPSQL